MFILGMQAHSIFEINIIYHVKILKKKNIYIIFPMGTQKVTKVNIYSLQKLSSNKVEEGTSTNW